MLSLLCSKNSGPPCGVQNPTWPGPVRICPRVPHAEDPTWPGPCVDPALAPLVLPLAVLTALPLQAYTWSSRLLSLLLPPLFPVSSE